MNNDWANNEQILYASNIEELFSMPFSGKKNSICFLRNLKGNFLELIENVDFFSNIYELSKEELLSFELSYEGQLARQIILSDLNYLKYHGADPILNIIESYERDSEFPNFPRDVYSFHVDRSPTPSSTFLCTYHGNSSEIIPNSQAIQKIKIQEIVNEIQNVFNLSLSDLAEFFKDNFFDLHYHLLQNAKPTNLGVGNLWKLATDYPDSESLPCIHRAPIESEGQKRLLLIC